MHTHSEEKSEFSEFDEDEIIHVKKLPPQEEDFDLKAKTAGFGMKFDPNTPWGEVRGEITHQYLKFVNAHIVERMNLIEKMVQMKNNLQREIDLLQSNDLTQLVRITDIPIKKSDNNQVKEISNFMKLQNSIIDSRKNQDESELEDSKIQKFENEFSRNTSPELDNLVKEELEFLIKKYGMKELTYAVDVITSSKLIKNNRELQ